MKNNIKNIIEESIKKITEENIEIEILLPKEDCNGDYSTNVALKLTKILKDNPINIANKIVEGIEKVSFIKEIKIEKPGFINFFLNDVALFDNVNYVIQESNNYGRNNAGENRKVNIEFVSVNPTGVLHLGHARNAFYGSSLANIMKFSGYDVTKEYYVNDAGNQINNLKNSVIARYKELCGYDFVFPTEGYHGKEIISVANSIKENFGDSLEDDSEIFKDYSVKYLLGNIQKDLTTFGVNFDVWTHEKDLYRNKEVENAFNALVEKGYTYSLDDAIYLRTTDFFDDKDRVIVKNTKEFTYLLPDIAYHFNKYNRGYDILIDVLGADHNGYIARLKSSMEMLNCNSKNLEIKILQLVKVTKDNEEVKMSKRSGNSITLSDLIEMIGQSAAKYFMVSKSLDTQMDLDLDIMTKKTSENPIFYIEYAYARIKSILFEKDIVKVSNFETIKSIEAINILKKLIEFEDIVISASEKREVHVITNYLYDLAGLFHGYYNSEKIVTEDEIYTNERLNLLLAISIVLENGLKLIDITPREKM